MAKPQAGTYRIVSAKGSSSNPFCLDVAGGSDKNGANVRIWKPNFTAAQFFVLSYRKDGTAQLLSKWSGKSLDVANGNVASGTNVQQWNDNDTRAQSWAIDSDGNSATYGGGTYPTYTVKVNGTTLALDISGGTMAAGTNVRVWTANGSEAQRWVLVEAPAFASGGIYELRSLLDTSMAVDVASASATKGANVQLWKANGTNAQKFIVTEESSGQWSIQNVNSDMFVDVASGSARSGANVQQWTDNDSRAQRWKLTEYGTRTIDGVECVVVTLGSYVDGSGSAYNMDVLNAMTTNKSNVDIETASNEVSQRFVLVPTNPIDPDMPVAADLGWTDSVGGTDWTRERPEAETYYPTWVTTQTWASDSFNHYEFRYRSQTMSGSNSAWGEFGEWTAWETASVTIDGQRVWLTDGLSAEVPSGKKALQYEIQVRSAGIDAEERLVHGEVADATLRAIPVPTVTFTVAGFGPEGLRLEYTSTYDAGTTNVDITDLSVRESGGAWSHPLKGDLYVTGLDQQGSIIVPMSRLSQWVADGSELVVTYHVGTDQGTSYEDAAESGALTVSYDTGYGLTVTPTYTVGEGRVLLVSVSTSGATVRKAWTTASGTLRELNVKGGTATVTYPFGMDFDVYAAAYSSDGDRWGVAHLSFGAEGFAGMRPCHAWNWDGGGFTLEVRRDEPLSTEYSVENDASSYKLNRRGWDAVRIGDTKTGKLTAEGAFGRDLDVEATRAKLEALIDARHVTYRSPHGIVCEVAIDGANLSCQRGVWECSVSMTRETV